MKLFSLEQERIVLAGILSFPDYFLSDISGILNEEDFYSTDSVVNKTIFSRMTALLDESKKLDIALLSHHLSSFKISFKDNISIEQYLESIDLLSQGLDQHSFKNACDVVKLLSIRRSFAKMGDQISSEMKTLDTLTSYDELLDACDSIYNQKIDFYEKSGGSPQNLFSLVGPLVRERADDRSIFKDHGPPGPHDSLNRLCGSLTKGGHITIVCAGSGVGKTQFTTHYCMYVAGKHKIPILHLDNGEMSEDEIAFRMCASYSRVPLHAIESGEWADNEESKARVESALKKFESGEITYDYYNVGGKNIDEVISYVRRYYYSKIGRGNKLIINYDYIKSSFELNSKFKTEYQIVGEIVDKFKKLIQRDLVFEGIPQVSLMSSVQANRQGTVGNRNSENVVDDESVISLSHRIKQFCSHLLILRNKTIDELQDDPIYCGRHIMKIEKARNHGADTARLLNEVEMPDGTRKKNYVNFEFDNFKIIDKGDLVDIVGQISDINNLETTNTQIDLPNI